jgi:ATP-binding cassette, subfamily B, bacterial
MSQPTSTSMARSFWSEFGLICRRAGQVWNLVPTAHKGTFAIAALLMALTSATAVAIPVVLGRLVDSLSAAVQAQASSDELFWTAGALLGVIAGLVVVREILNVLRRYVVENTCTRIDKQLSMKVVSRLLKVELASLTHEKLGSLNGCIVGSVDGYMRFLRAGFLDFLPAVLTGLLALAVAFFKAPWMGLVMAAVLPASVALTARQLLSQKDIRLKLIRTRQELDGNVVELLGGLDYVRIADTHAQEVKRFARTAEKRRQTELKHHVAMAFFGSAKALTEGFFHLVVLASAVWLAVTGHASFGDVFAFSGLFLSVMTPLAEVHRILDEGHEAALRVSDLLDMLNQPLDPSFCTETHRTARLDEHAPIVVTSALKVDYIAPDGRRNTALGGIDLQIYPGETIGVVGRSGCGKSTLIKVLTRVVHPCGGSVFLKGMPLEEVSRETIAQLIGYVGQSPFVFSGTVEENILYGYHGPCLPEVIHEAARRACIHDEVLAMPHGYATMIAERGANLSGGQRQRLALARIFLKDPPILILDEATSALDTISERSVQRAIDLARTDRTVILVAHRLSTLLDANRILVFDGGHLVEQGPYHELVKRGGVFAELVLSAAQSSSSPSPPAGNPGPQPVVRDLNGTSDIDCAEDMAPAEHASA